MATTLAWLEPIPLNFVAALAAEDKMLARLRQQLRTALAEHNLSAATMKRCVYVVRMTGNVVVAYPWGNSPVLYVGRGAAPTRLASHLGNWLHDVHRYGSSVGVELRICVPRKPNSPDFFKKVEADLILNFQTRYGVIPFFNARREKKWEKKTTHLKTHTREMTRALGVGSGRRPQWAIRPLPSHHGYDVFTKGFHPDARWN